MLRISSLGRSVVRSVRATHWRSASRLHDGERGRKDRFAVLRASSAIESQSRACRVYHSFCLSLPSSLPLSLRLPVSSCLSVCLSLSRFLAVFLRLLLLLSLSLSLSQLPTTTSLSLALCAPFRARSNDGRRAAVATARMSMRRVCVERRQSSTCPRASSALGIVPPVRRGSLPLECDISNEMETRCGW